MGTRICSIVCSVSVDSGEAQILEIMNLNRRYIYERHVKCTVFPEETLSNLQFYAGSGQALCPASRISGTQGKRKLDISQPTIRSRRTVWRRAGRSERPTSDSSCPQ